MKTEEKDRWTPLANETLKQYLCRQYGKDRVSPSDEAISFYLEKRLSKLESIVQEKEVCGVPSHAGHSTCADPKPCKWHETVNVCLGFRQVGHCAKKVCEHCDKEFPKKITITKEQREAIKKAYLESFDDSDNETVLLSVLNSMVDDSPIIL